VIVATRRCMRLDLYGKPYISNESHSGHLLLTRSAINGGSNTTSGHAITLGLCFSDNDNIYIMS